MRRYQEGEDEPYLFKCGERVRIRITPIRTLMDSELHGQYGVVRVVQDGYDVELDSGAICHFTRNEVAAAH